jgi:hypothetical protein
MAPRGRRSRRDARVDGDGRAAAGRQRLRVAPRDGSWRKHRRQLVADEDDSIADDPEQLVRSNERRGARRLG